MTDRVEDRLAAALAPGGTTSVFQPIVDIETGAVLGVEALARFGGSSESPEPVLMHAREEGRIAELDWACRASALQGALDASFGHRCTLFVNIEPDVLLHRVPDGLAELMELAERSLRIVIEVTETSVVEDPAKLIATVDWARDRGWGVALDDVGRNPASLAVLPFLEPDIIKLDLELVRAHDDPAVGEIVSAVLSQAERTGAAVLAEGIESDQHHRAALAMGATLAQGYRYGRPGPLQDTPASEGIIPFLRVPAHGTAATPFSVVRGARPLRQGPRSLLEGIADHIEEQALAWQDGPVILSTFDGDQIIPDRTRRRYVALAKSGATIVVLGPGLRESWSGGIRTVDLPPDSPLIDEWSVVVIGPHYAGALVARRSIESGTDSYDYAVTHDRSLVVAAGRTLLRRVVSLAE